MKEKMFQRSISILLIFILLVPYTYETKNVFAIENDSKELVVSAQSLYLREGPGLSYPIITMLDEGQALSMINQQGDWLHVKAGNTEGWVASWLTSTNNKKKDENSSRLIAISQVDNLNVRAEPSISSAILGKLNIGEEAEFLREENSWIQISYNGVIGWISSDYAMVNNANKGEEKKNDDSIHNDANTYTVVVDAAVIRKKPDLTSKKIGIVKKGKQYKVLEREQNWVKIKFNDKEGWIYNFYGKFNESFNSTTSSKKSTSSKAVTIIYNGTNLREEASSSSNVVYHADAGETFKIIGTEGDWYKIEVNNNSTAFVANWVVSTNEDNDSSSLKKKEKRKKGTLKGLTIVIDPGHGGNDKGTSGVQGTEEKDINLKTGELLKSKLEAAGANVILTRESDVYVDLRKRVSISHQYAADAFISIHYDATEDSSISGFTTYYMNSYQQQLAEYVHDGLAEKVSLKNRGAQSGNYLVLRENRQNAILIELGYLSNSNEERIVTTDYYREQATLGIYEGILEYFDAQL